MAKKLLNAELSEPFKRALDSLKVEFGTDYKRAAAELEPFFNRNTVKNFFTQPTKPFDNSQMERLIWYYTGGKERFLYNVMSGLVDQELTDAAKMERLSGTYIYFRHFSTSTNPIDLIYVHGRIEVYIENGIPRFSHWSHNHGADEPEHTGFLFRGGDNLFFFGTRPRVMRLAVTNCPPLGGNEKISAMYGIVLSLRSTQPYDPFSARFVMVSTKDEETISKLSDRTKVKMKWRVGSAVNTTMGAFNFFKMTRGEYAYYMLAMPHEPIEDREFPVIVADGPSLR